jgi:hypothetical protein
MSGFFAGGIDRYRAGVREQQDASLAVVCKPDLPSETERESELIAAEVAAVQGDFQQRLREAEYALF